MAESEQGLCEQGLCEQSMLSSMFSVHWDGRSLSLHAGLTWDERRSTYMEPYHQAIGWMANSEWGQMTGTC